MSTLLLLLACAPERPTWASAQTIDALDQGIGGPKAMARPGDLLLENDRIRVAVVGARASMGPSPYGGTVADVDLQRPDPRWGAGHGNDQFAEMFSTVNMNLVAADEEGEVTILADGSDGGAAIVRADAMSEPFLTMLAPLWTIVDQPEFRIVTDYILEPGVPALKIRSVATTKLPPEAAPEGTLLPGTPDTLEILDLTMQKGTAFGDFYLQGGAVDVFAPGVGFDEDLAVYEANQAGINTFKDPFRFAFVAGVGDKVSYLLATSDGAPVYVPLFTGSQTAVFGAGQVGDVVSDTNPDDPGDDRYDRFPSGASYRYERYLAVGKGDVGSALDALIEARGDAHGTVTGHVLEEGTGLPLSHVNVFVYEPGAEKPWSQWLTDVGEDVTPDGNFGGKLPPGPWELVVHAQGRPDGERVAIDVVEGEELDLVLGSPRPGQVSVQVVDEYGRPVPAKITFTGESQLDSVLGDDYVPAGAAQVVFTPDGRADVVLPAGLYTATASRGLEYELDVSPLFEVTDDGVSRLQMQVVRSVDTTGFVSADFHVHSINSFDSGTTLSDRVVTMVAEGVEFFTSTDHDYLTDYAPAVQDLGLEPWVKTTVGLETSTIEIGHYLGFPLADDPLADQGGAFDWTGYAPDDILDELEDIGVRAGYQPVRIVAHPRDGILGFFDQYGFDPYSGQVVTPTLSVLNELLRDNNFTDNYDALELLNGKRFEIVRTPTQPELDTVALGGEVTNYDLVRRTAQEQEDLQRGVYRLGYGHEGQVDDWFTLLNMGQRVTALGNSDTHGKFTIEAGCPRNYVVADTDDPASLDEQAIADAVREGRVVASYGPFVRFWMNDPENGVGADVVDTDGTVDLHIEVQAPTWVQVDRVEVYQNGTLIHEYEDLDGDVVKLLEDLPVQVDKDSWFVVIAMGDGDLAPVFTPVEMPPIQLQDVVTEALADVPGISSFIPAGVPIPRSGVVVPFALTNPIRVDVDGDGWEAPGLPSWLLPPEEPE